MTPLPHRKARALAIYERALVRQGLAPATLEQRRKVAGAFLHRFHGRVLGRLTTADLERYLAELAERVAPSSHAVYAQVICHFLATLVDEGLISRAPKVKLTTPPPPMGLLVSPTAMGRLLAAALDHPTGLRWAALRDRAALELLYGLGLRASECRAAQVVDLDLMAGTLLVRAAKRGPPRVLALPPASLPHLRAYLDDARPVLVRFGLGRDPGHLLLNREGKKLGETNVRNLVRAVARRAGVRATPHALRRGVATALVRAGVPVPAVQALLGHAGLDTTARYVAVDDADLRAAADLLDRPDASPHTT